MTQRFLNRLFLWIMLPIFGLFHFYIFKKPYQSISLVPHKNPSSFAIYPYSDAQKSLGKGQSIVWVKANDTVIAFTYELREGYQFPFAGVTLQAIDSSYFDLSPYDFIEMDIQATAGKRPQVILGAYSKGFTKPENMLTYRYIVNDIDLKKDQNKYSISLDKFTTPTWWYAENNISEKDIKPVEFDKVKILNIQSCQLLGKNIQDTIQIKELKFTKNVAFFYGLAGALLASYYLLLAFIFYSNRRPGEQIQKVEIQYTPVQVVNQPEKDLEKVVNFISTNYQDPEISLKKIQIAAGVPESKISSLLKDSFNLSFKQYLNNLRLNEAKRLLADLSLPVSDIAYKVGYGNISHFNRVFKDSLGISPNDFRKKNKTPN